MLKKVVVVAASSRFPGVDNAALWPALLEGRNLITQADASRWTHEEFLHPDKANPGTAYTFAAGSLGDVSGFDAGFFNISPREAASIDPQQRALLEMTWELFENAGVRPSNVRGSDCGVYLGLASVDHGYRLAEDMGAIDAGSATGNASSIAANRLSYFYDLHGPSMVVDTACSSSLVAVHQACQAIRMGEISQAIAGGISLHLHPFGFLVFSKASMLSRTGQCHVFDESADGYVRSEGGGLFLLKEYEQALADGNPILAFVAGTAINTTGRTSSLTLPGVEAQVSVMQSACASAGITADQIDYIEAHGTGTPVGDPIEAQAIGQALGLLRSRPLPIGSVKSNLGHLEAASGVAGMAKALLCLKHRQVPATVGITRLNPAIPFAELNLEVVTHNLALKSEGEVVVGVNSFGFGGANAHVILTSAAPPPCTEAPAVTGPLPLMVSARDEAGLAVNALLHAAHLNDHAHVLFDTAYHTLLRRDHQAQRVVVVSADPTLAAQALTKFADDASASQLPAVLETGTALSDASEPVWVFSGNGSQWSGMGRALLDDKVFSEAVAEIDTLFTPLAGYSLLAELAGKNGEDRYDLTEIAQPALFAVQVGVVRMLEKRGLKPQAVIGHSVGEVAAAWACGALSLADATLVIYHRSLLQGLTRGSGQMSAVGLESHQVQRLLNELGLADAVVVAGENSAKGATVAGSAAALNLLERKLSEQNVFVRRLRLDYAFHSACMDPIRQAVIEALGSIKPQAASIPFYSTVSGDALETTHLDAEYWWHNIRQPVLFQGAIERLVDQGCNVFVEVGPHAILCNYVLDALRSRAIQGAVIPTLHRNENRRDPVDRTLARLLIAGVTPQWQALFPNPGRWLQLPNYPWQRERHWHPVTAESGGLLLRERVHPLLGYPLPNQALHWENRLDTVLFPTLEDHRVGDAVLFPAAGFTELALTAALQFQPGEFVDIEELEILAPLILSGEYSKKVRVGIDPADGSLNITSRTTGGREDWAVHVVARLPGAAQGVMLDRRAPILPDRPVDFCCDDHLQLTRAAGLNYGPAYQVVEQGWWLDGGVLARLRMPASIRSERKGMHLHPALLDGAFQLVTQLLARDPMRRPGVAFIPVKLGRIAFACKAGVPTLAEVVQVRVSEHSLLLDFTLYDEDGRAVLHIKDARFRGVRLLRDGSADIKRLDTIGVAMPLVGADTHTTQAVSLHAALSTVFGDPAMQRQQAGYVNEVEPLLDSLCSRFFREMVDGLGGVVTPTRIAQWHTDAPDLHLFVNHLLGQGLEDGSLIRLRDRGWASSGPMDEIDAVSIWRELLRGYPEYFELIHSVGRIGSHLLRLLSAQVSLDELLPAETSPASLARGVLGASAYHALLGTLHEHIVQRLQVLPRGQRLRILELGMGGRPLAEGLCGRLDFDRVDYLYCADSLDLAALLQSDFADLRAMDFEEARQQLTGREQGFDLVLLATDLAPLAQLERALQFGSQRLRSDGQLLLLAQHPARWAHFVLAAQQGWWRDDLSPQQRPAFWIEQLERRGLRCEPPLELAPDNASGSYLLVAVSEGAGSVSNAVARQRYMLVASPQGAEGPLATGLTSLLVAAGQDVLTVAPDALDLLPSPDHIVMLAGLFSDLGVQGQTERCMLASTLMQLCEKRGITPALWLVTSGAASHLVPDAFVQPLSVDAIADAALWGFGRALSNEFPSCKIRLLDVPSGISAAFIAPVLLAQDAETEMALDRDGQRFVPRLRVLADHGQPDFNSSVGPVRLGFDFPGQLRHLRWEASPPISLTSDQLEVQVHATGLNFRDVMYALGLLSDEAIENGFSGPTLGFEFAGVVSGKGDQVQDDFLPGDRVVGFGPCSFANALVTSSNAVARIPEGMSFEAAATIPSAFFTVFYALRHLARLEPGETILIHGAAGGVGLAAVQIAKWCGARIYATAGSDEKRDFLRLLGVEHVFDSRSLAYADEILMLTQGVGIDVVLNSLAGEAINRNFKVLKPFGRFLELGKRDFYQNSKIGLRPFRNNISYFGIDADQLMSERPELTRRLFRQMMALFEEGVLSPLPFREFDANDIVEAFRYMQQARQIGKVVVTYRNPIQSVVDLRTASPGTLELDSAGSYLVTGGSGGFGLRTAQWLVEKGARHLVLLSRRGATSEEAQPALAAWRKQGIDVQALACDVSYKDQLVQVFDSLAQGGHPLRGVVHAATVINDGLIRNLDAGQLRSVMGAKALGAQHLDELTRTLSLDFFVVFSSATTLFGNPGQASYVAANHWLEALARNRLAKGLPATAVLWGAIDDVGFLARNQVIKDALQNRMGGSALPAAAALEQLEHMLIHNRSGLGILELDWKPLSRFLPSAQAPKFVELERVHGVDQAEEHGQDVQRMLQEMDDVQLAPLFADMLKHEVGEILRLPLSRLDSARPLQELGLDSLMSVELVVAVEERFGIRLPVMALGESPNIDRLTVRIIQALRGAHNTGQQDLQEVARDTLARHGLEVSAEDLERLVTDGSATRLIN